MNSYGRDHIRDLREAIDLREFAAEFTALRGAGERSGPCPKCGGHDRFHVQQHVYFCRQCRPYQNGLRYDVFDFVIWMNLADTFPGAVAFLERWQGVAPRREPPVRKQHQHSDDWQLHAKGFVRESKDRLMRGGLSDGQMYLTTRSLSRTTWDSHHLGATYINGTYAITIPWYKGGEIIAIQMRFTRNVDGKRYRRWGANGYYGYTDLYRTRRKITDTMVIVEGELNALSVWQDTPYNAVSFGSQSLTPQAELAIKQAASHYKKVYVWADKVDIAHRVVGAILDGGSTIATKIIDSPYDANDLLQKGRLGRSFAKQDAPMQFDIVDLPH